MWHRGATLMWHTSDFWPFLSNTLVAVILCGSPEAAVTGFVELRVIVAAVVVVVWRNNGGHRCKQRLTLTSASQRPIIVHLVSLSYYRHTINSCMCTWLAATSWWGGSPCGGGGVSSPLTTVITEDVTHCCSAGVIIYTTRSPTGMPFLCVLGAVRTCVCVCSGSETQRGGGGGGYISNSGYVFKCKCGLNSQWAMLQSEAWSKCRAGIR